MGNTLLKKCKFMNNPKMNVCIKLPKIIKVKSVINIIRTILTYK